MPRLIAVCSNISRWFASISSMSTKFLRLVLLLVVPCGVDSVSSGGISFTSSIVLSSFMIGTRCVADVLLWLDGLPSHIWRFDLTLTAASLSATYPSWITFRLALETHPLRPDPILALLQTLVFALLDMEYSLPHTIFNPVQSNPIQIVASKPKLCCPSNYSNLQKRVANFNLHRIRHETVWQI